MSTALDEERLAVYFHTSTFPPSAEFSKVLPTWAPMDVIPTDTMMYRRKLYMYIIIPANNLC